MNALPREETVMRTPATLLAALIVLAAPARAGAQPAFAPSVTNDGLIYVSAITAGPAERSAPVERQLDAVLGELASRLKGTGSSLGQVVSTSVFLANAADVPALNAAWQTRWPSAAPTRTTVVATLPAGALVMVSATAVPNGAERTIVKPDGWAAPPAPWNYAVRTRDAVFLSGLVSRKGADNSRIDGDMAAQTRMVLDNARAVLAAAGLTPADVVSAKVFVTDVAAFQAMNDVYRTYFSEAPPVRATVVARLLHPADLVEITLTAVPGKDRAVVTTPAADGSPGKPNPNLSSAIRVGRRLYLSGMLGITPGQKTDLAAQTQETLTRLERTMTLAGYSWSNVIDSTVYVTDISTADVVVRALTAKTGAARVSATVVGTGLVSPDGVVEIMLTAAKQE
jgi:2-iminobutanoate/2-iminopropanoate deaminase